MKAAKCLQSVTIDKRVYITSYHRRKEAIMVDTKYGYKKLKIANYQFKSNKQS